MDVENLPKVSSHSQKEDKDIATVERTEDDKSWMELSFVDDDGNEFAGHSAVINKPPESVSLDALTIDDEISVSSGALNDTPTAAEPPKPVEEEAKPASRRRPKKTKTHRKTKSLDDRILMGDSGSTRKKKKKKEKTGKKNKGGSDEFSAKSRRKQKKRTSGKEQTDDGTEEALLTGETSSDDQSLMSDQSPARSKSPNKRRGLKSLSPIRMRNPLKAGLVRQLSGSGGGLLGRAKGLKGQLAMSDHVPRDRKGIMGTVLYASFDNDSDSDLENDDLFG